MKVIDEVPNRTEKLIPMVAKALGESSNHPSCSAPRSTLCSTVRQMLSVRGETPVPLRRISPPWINFGVILL